MNIFFKPLSVSFLFFISVNCSAWWTGSGKVEGVYSHNGYHVILTTITDNSCGAAGKFYWPISDPDAKDMLSIALTALTTDKDVRVLYNDSQPTCRWSGELSTHLLILK